MDPSSLPPISGHSILVLLVQLALLLFLARSLSEVMRRIGQPAVIGELLAGILLGPTVLGHWSPDLYLLVFPQDVQQFHLLEIVSWLGMVLLLLLTGFETDLRVVRTLGKSAFFSSAGGLTVTLASGFALGMLLPEQFLVDPSDRVVFAAFLATSMAITAMPVIAKILIDLNLIKRNVGVVILSAGVLDDTIGWLILSVIAGIASAGVFSGSRLALTLVGLAGFLLVVRFVGYPVFTRMLGYVNAHVRLPGADVSLILVFTFLGAAVTEMLGVHAVFGAFVTGLMIRQVPRVKEESLHALETFVLAALSPIFFAFVGLKVNLWLLTGWQLPALVIAVAMVAKLVGCFTGARLAGMSFWESLAIGFGMNARGAMELIVALIGLSLGLLTGEMYSTIVLLAVVTSFLAPLLMRAVLPRLPMTDEERRRIEDDSRGRVIPAGALKILVPTAGGGNVMGAFALAAPLVRNTGGNATALYVETRQESVFARIGRRLLGNPSLAGRGLEAHLEQVAERFGEDQKKYLNVKRVRSTNPGEAILAEEGRDYDLLMIGAAPRQLVGRSMTVEVLSRTTITSVIVRAPDSGLPDAFRQVLVPVDGSVFSRVAAEFAFAYASSVDATVTLLHVVDETEIAAGALMVPDLRVAHALEEAESSKVAERLRTDFAALAESFSVTMHVRVLGSGDPASTIIAESWSRHTD
ncbi:MAG TPA: cation:proton antiporter, partial [Gemmatimonadales bacterium]|nr:cation:proton antiporter [Gemmatimonadales bacterium]